MLRRNVLAVSLPAGVCFEDGNKRICFVLSMMTGVIVSYVTILLFQISTIEQLYLVEGNDIHVVIQVAMACARHDE